MCGVLKLMKVFIDSLVENFKWFLEGEIIVEIDIGFIDVLFVNDWLSGDDEVFEEFKSLILNNG